jgi:capsular exopolysaccharide synthesis family protein
MDHSVGVTTVLLGAVSFDDALQKHPLSDLHVLSSGAIPPNPADLLQSKAMAELVVQARQRYDMVIIDAPPLLPVTDGALIATASDGALLVVRHGRTTIDQLAQARDRLVQVDARVVGTVLNMVPGRGRNSGYGYGYGYAPETEPQPASRPRRAIRRRRLSA